MSDEATVHVNRDGRGTLAVPAESVDSRGSFALRLDNHGPSAHVHCRLEGDLATAASTPQANYFVAEGGETTVPIEVDAAESAVEGRIEVSTRYGAEAATIDVTVDPVPDEVAVDESLAEPPADDPDPAPGERAIETVTGAAGVDAGTLGVLAFAGLALGLAVVAAGIVGGAAAFVGVLVVAAGVAVALAILLR